MADPTHYAPYLRFGYDVVRSRDLRVQRFLNGGLATLPLAPLAKVTKKELSPIIRQMEARISREAATPADIRTFWASTFLLMGLRYTPSQINNYLKGVQQLKESSTYQAILAEGREEEREAGREEGIRSTLLRLGSKRLGTPSLAVINTLNEFIRCPD